MIKLTGQEKPEILRYLEEGKPPSEEDFPPENSELDILAFLRQKH